MTEFQNCNTFNTIDDPTRYINGSSAKAITPKTEPGHNHETCTAAGQINFMVMQLSEITQQLSDFKTRIIKLETDAGNNNHITLSEAKSITRQVNNVTRQVEIMVEGLRSTPDYNMNKTFNCGSCGSPGTVSIKVKCTRCGQENWWGFWPQKK